MQGPRGRRQILKPTSIIKDLLKLEAIRTPEREEIRGRHPICSQVSSWTGTLVANSHTAVATACTHVETGILSGEGGERWRSTVLSNLKWLTSQAVNQPSRARGCCCCFTAADHKPSLAVGLDHALLSKQRKNAAASKGSMETWKETVATPDKTEYAKGPGKQCKVSRWRDGQQRLAGQEQSAILTIENTKFTHVLF